MIDSTMILLQACGQSAWLNGSWQQCIIDPVPTLIGDGMFGLLIGGGTYIALYLAGGGRATTATVSTILVASALFPLLPGRYKSIAWSALLVGAAAAIMQAGQKYVISPSTK